LVAIKLEVAKADLLFEAGLTQPEFVLFRDTSALLHHLYKRLEPHGLRLNELRIERGSGNVADYHVLCYLFNYWMTIRVRLERIEIVCSDLPEQYVEKFKAAILDVLRAVKDHRPELSYRAFELAVGLHARLEGQPARDYLARFVANIPPDLGPSTGSGTVFYFGPEGDRLLSSVTVDMSAMVPDAVYLRLYAIWDAKKIVADSLPALADGFVRHAVDKLGLQLPR
jgi:hypothetical protein